MFAESHDRVFHFKGSVLGFDSYDAFRFTVAEENPLFGYLESVENTETGFIVTSPFRFFPNYEFQIEDKEKEDLAIEKPEDVMVLSIIHVNKPFTDSTVNLMAPLIVNLANNQGRQIILTSSHIYSTKEKLFKPTLAESGDGSC